jgi:two-component system invasion response regulator UvrY
LIADDHHLFREALAAALDEASWLEVIATASSGQEAVDLALVTDPDIVVMDVRMPGIDGLEATRRLRVVCPSTQVVLMSGLDDLYLEEEARRAGASLFVTKDILARGPVEIVTDLLLPAHAAAS